MEYFDDVSERIRKKRKFLDSLISGVNMVNIEVKKESITKEMLFIAAPIVAHEPYLPSFPVIFADLSSRCFYAVDKYETIPEENKIVFNSSFTKRAFEDPKTHPTWLRHLPMNYLNQIKKNAH